MRFIRTAYYNSEVPVFNFGVMKLTECGLSGPPSQGSNGADYWSKSADAKNVTLQDLVAVSLSLVHVTHTLTGRFSPHCCLSAWFLCSITPDWTQCSAAQCIKLSQAANRAQSVGFLFSSSSSQIPRLDTTDKM